MNVSTPVGRSPRWVIRLVIALTVTLAMITVGVQRAGAAAYAPPNTPGPALSVPTAQLSNALTCTGTLSHTAHPPILLVPGTTLDASEFSWNWDRALSAQNWPFCTINLPDHGMADIQTAGEYVVYAIRTMHARAGEKIDVVGHSQGGMVPRWALRFWPDTRAMVDDLVGLSPSNHGTVDADGDCALTCAPSIWQQQDDSHFLAALNSDAETFAPISYTDIYTQDDEVVVPNSGANPSSALHTGTGQITNVSIQSVCPTDLTEHLGIGTYDNTAYAIAMDALTHAGPAVPGRVSSSVCSTPLMPGVDPASFATNFATIVTTAASQLATYPHSPTEPALACYVTASCPMTAKPALGNGKAAASKPAARKKPTARNRAHSARGDRPARSRPAHPSRARPRR